MKPRAVVLTLLALVALCVAAGFASSASATPAFGICRKHTGGKYEAGNCTKKAGVGSEKYEWYPVVGAEKEEPALTKPEFKLSFGSAEPIVFETTTEVIVECTSGSASGDFSANQIEGLTREVENVVVTYKGCTRESKTISCTGTGLATGEMVTNSLDGILGDWKKEAEKRKDKPGLELFPPGHTGSILSANCGGAEYSQKGAVIAQVNLNEINNPMTEILMKYAATGGEQKPSEFLSGEPSVPPFVSKLGSFEAQTGLTASFTLKEFAGELEVRAGVNGT